MRNWYSSKKKKLAERSTGHDSYKPWLVIAEICYIVMIDLEYVIEFVALASGLEERARL